MGSTPPRKEGTLQVKWGPLLLSENSEKKDPILTLTKALCKHLPKNIKMNFN